MKLKWSKWNKKILDQLRPRLRRLQPRPRVIRLSQMVEGASGVLWAIGTVAYADGPNLKLGGYDFRTESDYSDMLEGLHPSQYDVIDYYPRTLFFDLRTAGDAVKIFSAQWEAIGREYLSNFNDLHLIAENAGISLEQYLNALNEIKFVRGIEIIHLDSFLARTKELLKTNDSREDQRKAKKA